MATPLPSISPRAHSKNAVDVCNRQTSKEQVAGVAPSSEPPRVLHPRGPSTIVIRLCSFHIDTVYGSYLIDIHIRDKRDNEKKKGEESQDLGEARARLGWAAPYAAPAAHGRALGCHLAARRPTAPASCRTTGRWRGVSASGSRA